MEPKFNITTDSSCDFSPHKIKAMAVPYASFTYAEAGKPDGGFHGVDDLFQSIKPQEFYDAVRSWAAPMTSQPSQAAYEDLFNAALETGKPTLHIAMSSGISGAYNGACLALDHLKEERGVDDLPIYIVDSGVTSTSQYLFLSEAIRRRDSGCSFMEAVAWAQSARYRVRTIFMVDSLDTLHRGGRIPKSVAVVAGALDAKPLLGWNLDGSLKIMGVARGRKKGMKKMLEYYETHRDKAVYETTRAEADEAAAAGPLDSAAAPAPMVALGNAGCRADSDRLGERLREVDPAMVIEHSNIGPTIACHVGAGMMSCCFWGADRHDDPEKLGGKIRGVQGV